MDKIPDLKELSFSEIIELSGLSDSVLAEKLEVSRNTIYRWRKGSHVPPAAFIKYVKEILK